MDKRRGFELIKARRSNYLRYMYVANSSLDGITLAAYNYKPAAQSDIIKPCEGNMPCFMARLLRIRPVVFVSPQRVKRDENKTTNGSLFV